MSSSVSCPNCGKPYRVDARAAGKKVRCRDCKSVFPVPMVAADDRPNDLYAIAKVVAPISTAAESNDPFAQIDDVFHGSAATATDSAPRVGPPPIPPPKATIRHEILAPSPVASQHQLIRVDAAAPAMLGYKAQLPVRRINPVGGDSATPWLILLLILAHLATAVVTTVNYFSLSDAQREMMPISIGAVWVTLLLNLILFFAIVGPLTFLGVFVSSKIMKFEVVDAAYIKAAGIASVPAVVLAVMAILPENLILQVALIIGIVPLAFYVLKFAFDLKISEAIVSFVFAGPLYVIGQFVSIALLAVVASGFVMSAKKSQMQARMKDAASPGLFSSSNGNSSLPTTPMPARPVTPPSPPPPPVDPADRMVTALRRDFDWSHQNLGDLPREALLDSYGRIKELIEGLRRYRPDHPALSEFNTQLAEFEKSAMAAPSKNPPKEIYQDFGPLSVWEPSETYKTGLGDEQSYKGYRLQLPKDAKVDLRTSEGDVNGLSWGISVGNYKNSRLTIFTRPREQATQKRPWAATRRFMLDGAESKTVFAIDATNGADVSAGSINGIPFTRVQAKADSERSNSERRVKYAAPVDEGWLVVQLVAPSDDAPSLEVLDTAVRTLRRAKKGEKGTDAFTPERLIARLKGQDSEEAFRLLVSQGSRGEDAILPLLSGEDADLKRTAAKLLEKIGTKKSLPALGEAAKSSDRRLAESARAALRRIAPDSMDAVTDALLQLNDNAFNYRSALKTLAETKADDKRREEVLTALFKLLENTFPSSDDTERFAFAFAQWADDKTAPKLAGFVSETAKRSQRLVAIKTLGAMKYAKGAPLVVNRLDKETEEATSALIEMGPAAEDALLPLLAAKMAPKAREVGAKILSEIGSKKSIPPLTRAANDGRNQSAAAAAQAALQAVKARTAILDAPAPR